MFDFELFNNQYIGKPLKQDTFIMDSILNVYISVYTFF